MRIETYTRDDLGKALASRVAGDLRQAIYAGRAPSIAVPGGSTPAPFLAALAEADLDWRKITVALTDERCVPPGSERSNQRLVRQHLLHGPAAAARFLPLYDGNTSLAAASAALAARAMPLDVCVLGMGGDMHTASLFPGLPNLAALLDPASEALLAKVQPSDGLEPRVTMTARALTSAARTYLLIAGLEKKAALETAMTTEPTAAPIRAILNAAQSAAVFYAV